MCVGGTWARCVHMVGGRVAVSTVTPLCKILIELPTRQVSGLGARRGAHHLLETWFCW